MTARVLRAAEVLLVALAVGATVPIYGPHVWPLLAVTGAGVLLAALTSARWWAQAPALLGGYVVVRTATVHGLPSWHALTTAGPVLVVYVCGFAAAATLRSRSLLVPLLFPLQALVAGLLLTGGPGTREAAAVLGCLLLLVLVRTVRLDEPYLGRLRYGLPIVGAVAAAGLLCARLMPVGDRLDMSAFGPARTSVSQSVTPLATVRGEAQESPPRMLFTVRVSGASLDRVRTAALDRYDGALWTSDDRFLAAGRTLGSGSSAGIDLRVTVVEPSPVFLPSAGEPERVDRGGLGFSAASGVLISNGRPVGSYDLTAGLRAPTHSVRPDLGSDTVKYRELPPQVPAVLIKQASRIAAGAVTPYGKLEALRTGLRDLPYDPKGRPGHSLARLAALFAAGRAEVPGYAEQHAAAFALMARILGYPSRVVTGYLLRPESLSGGVYTVRTSDAWAWAEVKMTGVGWMAFDPTDPLNSRHRTAPPLSVAVGGDGHAVPPDSAGHAPNLSGDGSPLPAWVPVAAVLAALMLLLPAGPAAARWIRCRRRRRGSSAERVAGAWRQSTDRLRKAGLPIQRSWTALETAERARARFGDKAAPVAVLAPLVGAACHGARPLSREAADEAWRADHALRLALRRERGPVAAVRSLRRRWSRV